MISLFVFLSYLYFAILLLHIRVLCMNTHEERDETWLTKSLPNAPVYPDIFLASDGCRPDVILHGNGERLSVTNARKMITRVALRASSETYFQSAVRNAFRMALYNPGSYESSGKIWSSFDGSTEPLCEYRRVSS